MYLQNALLFLLAATVEAASPMPSITLPWRTYTATNYDSNAKVRIDFSSCLYVSRVMEHKSILIPPLDVHIFKCAFRQSTPRSA